MNFTVPGRSPLGEPTGYDSVIMQVPATIYVEIKGEKVLVVKRFLELIRTASFDQAATMGEVLHHAEWILTDDPAEVQTKGLMHDCATCRAGVDQALAHLRDNPTAELLLGQLFWAAP